MQYVIPFYNRYILHNILIFQFKQEEGIQSISLTNTDYRKNALGHQGVDANVHLILRIVADIGIIGLPNAGKF